MTQPRRSFQIGTGLFILLGFAALAYLATQTTSVANYRQGDSYAIKAKFSNIGQLKVRAPVKLAGVRIGSVQSIDQAMKLGANHPMGPFELADFIGLDTCLAIMNVLYDGLADTKYRPCPLLTKYVDAGWLGRKTGRGFYDYRGETPVPTR